MMMDFSNYTLGRLVEGRQNYDNEHKEYKIVKANILWRIYKLGYSINLFGKIDRDIGRAGFNYGRHADGRKVDRYGKKYCWIAFYELAGLRQDRNLLSRHYNEIRIYDADIDPSFPDPIHEFQVIKKDLLGSRKTKLTHWIERGSTPDITSYLIIDKLFEEKGPWVLLDGYISQEDLKERRGCAIMPRSIFIQRTDLKEAFNLLIKHPFQSRWLPEIPENYDTYAGEIPWCNTVNYNGWSELEFILSTIKKEIINPAPVILIKGQPSNYPKRIVVEITDKVKIIKVFIPVREYHWSYEHSSVNPGQTAIVPAKEIADIFNLFIQPPTFDLYERNRKRASITLRWGDTWHTGHRLIYIRKDLLDRYLTKKKLGLIWAIWGERQFKCEESKELHEFMEKHKPQQVFKMIKVYQPSARGK